MLSSYFQSLSRSDSKEKSFITFFFVSLFQFFSFQSIYITVFLSFSLFPSLYFCLSIFPFSLYLSFSLFSSPSFLCYSVVFMILRFFVYLFLFISVCLFPSLTSLFSPHFLFPFSFFQFPSLSFLFLLFSSFSLSFSSSCL
jgi:hypothetical protein